MFVSMNDLRKYYVNSDGKDIGLINEFLFNEISLDIKYITIDADGIFSGRKFVFSPLNFGIADRSNKSFPIYCSDKQLERSVKIENQENDYNILSSREVLGYHLNAFNEMIGVIDDIIVDDIFWEIRFFVMATGCWLHCRKYLFTIDLIDRLNSNDNELNILISRSDIFNSPEYNPCDKISTEFVGNVHNYYNNLYSEREMELRQAS